MMTTSCIEVSFRYRESHLFAAREQGHAEQALRRAHGILPYPQGIRKREAQAYLDAIAPLPPIDPPPPDTSPIRGLPRTPINAILYATSANVEPELRSPPARAALAVTARARRSALTRSTSCPGTIDSSRVRKLQEIERSPEGRELLRRHMVRGHWRRAQKAWADQHLRWIEPYWKGPDMAAIIEHAFRLKPGAAAARRRSDRVWVCPIGPLQRSHRRTCDAIGSIARAHAIHGLPSSAGWPSGHQRRDPATSPIEPV
jgi:hypothetical protein